MQGQAENRSLRDVNLSLKQHYVSTPYKHDQDNYQSPMFYSKGQHSKTMIRAQFFLINRNAEPSFLFQGLLHELPSLEHIFTIGDQVYQVKDFTRTLIPSRNSDKVREGDVRVLVSPQRAY